MKTLLATLLLATLCAATGYGQTIKALSYDTTNGIVLAGTNRVQFTNRVSVPSGGGTNDIVLRLGTNNTGFFVLTTPGQPVAFVHNNALSWAVSTNDLVLYKPIVFVADSNAAISRTNLGLGGGVITNIDVLVSGGGTNTLQFSNGILTNVTAP